MAVVHLGNSRDYYGFNPLNIRNCSLWLDGKDASSVTTVSGAVSQWNDKGPIGYNVSQATAGNRPTYDSATGAITFSGSPTSQALTNAANIYINTYSIYVVYKPNVGASSLVALDQRYTLGAVGTAGFYRLTGAGLTSGYGSVLSNRTQSWTLPTTVTVIGFFSSVGSGTYSYNGTTPVNTGTTANSTNATGILTIGNSSVSATSAFNGDIYEVIFYNRILSDQENEIITGYLGWKWGNPSTYSPAYPTTNTYYYGPPLSRSLIPLDLFDDNVVLWLDGADDNTLTFSSGTTVSTWFDKASGIYASVYTEPTGPTAFTGPTYTASNAGTADAGSLFFNNANSNVKSAGDNGLRLMRFGGTATSFTPLSMTSLNWAIYIVYKSTRATNTTLNDIIQIRPRGSSLNYGYSEYHIEIGQGPSAPFVGPSIFNGTNLQFSTNTSWSTANQYNILGVFYTGTNGSGTGSVNIRMNGAQNTAVSGSFGTALSSQIDFTLFSIGAHIDNRIFSGYIKEIIVIDNTTIGNIDVQTLEGYLAWKWGLTANLPTTHNFKNYEPQTTSPFTNLSPCTANFFVVYNTRGDPLYRCKAQTSTLRGTINDSCVDATNNIITCGEYNALALSIFNKNDVAFGTTLASNGTSSASCAYLAKYGPQGEVKWVTRALCTTDANNGFTFTNVSTDQDLGVYVVGNTTNTGSTSINKTITFYNSGGTSSAFTFSTGATYDSTCVITKYDTNGTYQWNSSLTTNTTSGLGNSNSIQAIDVAQAGTALYLGGKFYTTTLTIGGTTTITQTSTTAAGVFILNYTTSGTLSNRAKMVITGTGNANIFLSQIKTGGSVICCGTFDVNFDIFSSPSTGASARTLTKVSTATDGFVVQFNTSLAFLRAMKISGGGSTSISVWGTCLLVTGNTAACGSTTATTTTFYNASDVATLTLTKGSETIVPFLVSYSSTGVPQWVVSTTGTASSTTVFRSVANYGNAGFFILGYTTATSLTFTSISSSGKTFNFVSRGFTAGDTVSFVAYYSSSGIIQWVRQIANLTATGSLTGLNMKFGGNLLAACINCTTTSVGTAFSYN